MWGRQLPVWCQPGRAGPQGGGSFGRAEQGIGGSGLGESVSSVQCVVAATRTKLQSPQPISQVPILKRFLSMHALSGWMAGMDA